MTALWLSLTWLAGTGFYLACAHQRFCHVDAASRRWLRIGGWLSTAAAVVAASVALGVWPGIFAAMTSLMLVLVALPYLDVWWHSRQRHGQARP